MKWISLKIYWKMCAALFRWMRSRIHQWPWNRLINQQIVFTLLTTRTIHKNRKTFTFTFSKIFFHCSAFWQKVSRLFSAFVVKGRLNCERECWFYRISFEINYAKNLFHFKIWWASECKDNLFDWNMDNYHILNEMR